MYCFIGSGLSSPWLSEWNHHFARDLEARDLAASRSRFEFQQLGEICTFILGLKNHNSPPGRFGSIIPINALLAHTKNLCHLLSSGTNQHCNNRSHINALFRKGNWPCPDSELNYLSRPRSKGGFLTRSSILLSWSCTASLPLAQKSVASF